MTKILLGIIMTAFVLALEMVAQSPAMAMTENPQSDMTKEIASQAFGTNNTMMLVAISPAHKGDKTTFMLVPRPAEGIDGIPIPTQAPPDMMLVAHASPNGGKPTFAWIPRPFEGIDDIPLPKPVQQSPVMEASQTSTDPTPMILVAISPTHKGDKAILMWVPKPVENVDDIPTPKSTPDLIMVAHASPNGGPPIFTWIPRPAPTLADHLS